MAFSHNLSMGHALSLPLRSVLDAVPLGVGENDVGCCTLCCRAGCWPTVSMRTLSQLMPQDQTHDIAHPSPLLTVFLKPAEGTLFCFHSWYMYVNYLPPPQTSTPVRPFGVNLTATYLRCGATSAMSSYIHTNTPHRIVLVHIHPPN